MLDDRLIDSSGAGDNGQARDRLDQYIERYLEYLDGERAAAPPLDELTAEERAEARDVVRLFRLHRGRERKPAATTEETYVRRPPADLVVVLHHTADRGWANWISLELESAGLHCWTASFDRPEPARIKMPVGAIEPAQIIAVVSSVATTYCAASDSEPAVPFCRSEIPLEIPAAHSRLLAVRVEDCQAPDLLNRVTPTSWLDLVGHDEAAARRVLLERVAGQAPALQEAEQSKETAQGCRYSYPKCREDLLQRLMTIVGRREFPSLESYSLQKEECRSIQAQAGALAQATSRQSEPLPPVLRETLRDLVGSNADRWLDVAEVLTSLARVKIALGSVDQALAVRQQAHTIRELFDVEEQVDGPGPQDRSPVIRPGRRKVLPSWRVAGRMSCN